MRHNYRIYTDPALTQGLANKLRQADTIFVRFAGSTSVFVTADSPEHVLSALVPMEGYSLRDVKECI